MRNNELAPISLLATTGYGSATPIQPFNAWCNWTSLPE